MHHHHHQHRRRKKRPNYGTRTVEVSRGFNGFGFTISGQQPCILSCIVANSPADQAGLRAGDFLISVNNLNVSKLPHETVVQLIGNSFGSIKMQIAENYFSDSSDEENAIHHINRGKPSYLHHKLKMNRLRTSPQKHCDGAGAGSSGCREQSLRPVIEDIPLPASLSSSASHNIIHSPNASTSKDISNVSAMVRVNLEQENANGITLEYRAIVGYLGTIEMPKQIAISSKLQTVRSCIRKLRQEKRNPTTVLMTILPNCLTLQSSNATILATYPSSRLNYVSSSSESENRFFGLVTSAIYSSNGDDDEQEQNGAQRDVSISNSCHVFVVDTKICDHHIHEQRATEFRITCTKDPISNLCLEFPNNSEYVVNLIRSMYTMRILPPAARNPGRNGDINRQPQDVQAHSPQPSNHSEVTTASSNSDSGIGFHNDCTNISDRILVVDFPGIQVMANRVGNVGACARPAGIFNNIEQCNPPPVVDTRLTVRAMPDPKATTTPPLPKTAPPPPQSYTGPNLLASLNLIKSPISSLVATRSCDDVLSLMDRQPNRRSLQMSMDDISIHSSSHHGYDNVSGRSPIKDHIFIPPLPTGPKQKKSKQSRGGIPYEDGCCFLKDSRSFHINKLSPKVYGMMDSSSRGNSASVENLASDGVRKTHGFSKNDRNVDGDQNAEDFETWGSLQNIHKTDNYGAPPIKTTILEATYSEPDLGSRALPSDASPFRRWAQSSFRAPRTVDSQVSLARRPSSLTASDNDVYTKSMESYIGDFKAAAAAAARSQLADVKNIVNGGSIGGSSNSKTQEASQPAGVASWGSSFEKLLEDPAGLHTFAEFLKKEFSAENIYFWTACERYRFIESASERATSAMDIYSKHLANGAIEPVNVDSQARTTTQENLKTAEKDLFAQAQKQIFNLMKFDSYQRFIRSDMYKKCIEAEEKHQPLPYSAEGLDELLKTNFHLSAHSMLKKSASNAEDRRRKSLLPWHRKTRCKSRDRDELDNQNGNNKSSNNRSGKSQLSGNSLKITNTRNSTGDVHSSRSSLSSFDTLPQCTLTNTSDDIKACCLCRVILCDGATTIVQTKPDETVRQLVERLLEKRGISYQLFDVILNSTNKPVDLDESSQILSGKELLIEQKVAFKLDLPDPKVISVKSKPKKALCDVIKPILQKYNYCMENVQILMRDTHEQVDLSQPVTIADGQRLQVVMLKTFNSEYPPPNIIQPKAIPKSVSFPAIKPHRNGSVPTVVINTQQSTLDEITNKVFSELLQGKVESHDGNQKAADVCSLKSNDCASETSSIFDRIRRRDSNIPGLKGLRTKKINKTSISQSDDALTTSTQIFSTNSDPIVTKKPIIAKWKAGVKVQVTERAAENPDELLEGLKRAQCARLEDQRGTEINFELPDFLKNKENLSAANKLRKIRANLSPVNKSAPVVLDIQQVDRPLPQPAPRLSITKKQSISPMKIDEEDSVPPTSTAGSAIEDQSLSTKGPPPLPPKPKVLPIKPSNWGHSSTTTNGCSKQTAATSPTAITIPLPSKIPVDISRKHLGSEQTGRTAYLDEPSSSFV